MTLEPIRLTSSRLNTCFSGNQKQSIEHEQTLLKKRVKFTVEGKLSSSFADRRSNGKNKSAREKSKEVRSAAHPESETASEERKADGCRELMYMETR